MKAFIPACALFVFPVLVWGAELSVETFDYPADSHLAGTNGGSGWGEAWICGASQLWLNQVRDNVYRFEYPGYSTAKRLPASGGTFLNLAAGYGGPTFNYAQRAVDLSESGPYAEAGLATTNDAGFPVVGGEGQTLWISLLYQSDSGNASLWLQQLVATDAATSYQIPFPALQLGEMGLLLLQITYHAEGDVARVWWSPDLSTWEESSTPDQILTGDMGFSNFIMVVDGDNREARFDDARLGTDVRDVLPVVGSRATVLAVR